MIHRRGEGRGDAVDVVQDGRNVRKDLFAWWWGRGVVGTEPFVEQPLFRTKRAGGPFDVRVIQRRLMVTHGDALKAHALKGRRFGRIGGTFDVPPGDRRLIADQLFFDPGD